LFLLEHLPPGLRIVLASRFDPPLPGAAAGCGQLVALRAAELRFTADGRRRCCAKRLALTTGTAVRH
jgi:ATP/maltotriose-dependent transcriptional regulator MalT